MDYDCPRPAALETILRKVCPENLGQIVRVAILRAGGFQFDPGADPALPIQALATWTPLLSAVDDTKVVLTPDLDNFIIPESEAITVGGGTNETVDGVERVTGEGPITVTSMLTSVPVSIIEQIRDLMAEPALEVILFNQYNKIIARNLTPTETDVDAMVFGGIPIQSLYCPYPGNQGYATLDSATFRFAFDAEWAKDRVIITPDFLPRTQLLAPVS